MAISFVASGTVASGSNPSVGVPAGLQAFDLLLIITTGTATPSTPTGWTQVAAQGAGRYLTVLQKITTTGTESAVSLTLTGSTSKAVMLAYRGAGNYDVVGTFSNPTGTTVTAQSQTTRLNNDYVLCVYGNASGAARTWTAPGSTTTRVNSSTTSTISGLLVVDELDAVAGATTARTATISASSALSGVQVSIREPQTLYWTGTGNWSSTTLWKTTSGGGTTIGAPTQNDSVVFDGNGTSCTINSASACTDLTVAADFGGTIAGTSTLSIAGSYVEDMAGFTWSYTGAVTFIAKTTGKTIGATGGSSVYGLSDNALTFNGVGGEWTLQPSGIIVGGGTKAITLTAGTIKLNDSGLYGSTFNASGTTARTIDAGAGANSNITTTATNSTVIDIGTTTNLTMIGHVSFASTPLTSGTGTRTVTLGNIYTESNAPTLVIGNAGDTVSITATSLWDLGFYFYGTGTTTVSNTALTVFNNLYIEPGAFTFTGGTNAWTFAATSGTKTITSFGNTLDCPLTFSGVGGTWQLQDALTTGSTRTVTLANGTLDLNNYNLTAGFFTITGSPTLAFGTGQMYITASGTTVFTQTSTATITGTPVVNLTYSGGTGARTVSVISVTEANSISFNVTAGTDQFQHSNIAGIRDLNFTGFSGTWGNNTGTIYGSLTISTGMTVSAGASARTFGATSGIKTITSNGKTLDFPITFSGIGGTWQLLDALTTGATRTITLTNGALDLNNNDVTCGYFSSNNGNTRTIAFGTGQFYVTGNNGGVWRTDNAIGLTVTGSDPTVNATYSGATGSRSIINTNGSGTYATAVNINVTAGTDIVSAAGNPGMYKNVNFTGFSGSSTWFGNVLGNLTLSSTMTQSTASAMNFINHTGTQTITSNGVTMDCPVFFGQRNTLTGASGNGTTATVTFGSSINLVYPVGSTIQVAGVNPSSYDGTYTVTASTLTSVSFASTTTATYVNGGSVFAGSTIDLAGALTIGSTRALVFSRGTLNLNNNNLSSATFSSTGIGTKVLNTGTGELFCTSAAAGTVFNIADATNFTKTGSFIVNFTGAPVSGTNRTFAFGNTAGGTETNAPSLNLSAGSDDFTIAFQSEVNNVNLTGFSGSILAQAVRIFGDLTIPSGVTWRNDLTNSLLFSATSGTKTITTNGVAINQSVTFDGVGGTWNLGSDLTVLQSFLRVTNGAFNANGFNVTTPSFQSNSSNVRSVTMGTGTWTINGSGTIWTTSPSTNLTFSGASSTIVLEDTSTTARAFTSGTGLVHGNLVFSGSNNVATTFSGASTWGTWSSTKTVPFTITLAASTTFTVADWTISGSAGNLVTLNSGTPGTRATLSKSSGTVNVSYMDIKDSNATGGATWNALLTNGNINSGNNSGWIFSLSSGNFLIMF